LIALIMAWPCTVMAGAVPEEPTSLLGLLRPYQLDSSLI
jgi:hypothetical protein